MREITNEETGEKEILYTKEELDAQLAEKDKHVEAKLEEFKKGKTAQELKEIETQKKIEEIEKKANESVTTANSVAESAHKKVVNYIASQFVGEDKELRTKLDSAFEIIEAGRIAKGLDVKDEASIAEMYRAASQMSGINAPANPVFPMTGGVAPSFIKTPNEISDAEHEAFLKATGQYEAPKKKE